MLLTPIRHARILPAALCALSFSVLAPAQRVARAHADGTTHWYEPVVVPAGIDWPGANQAAADAGGYLVTITSPEENSFVFGLVDRPDLWSQDPTTQLWEGPWTGGVQLPGASEPGGGWAFAELEPFTYAGWAPGQPDDAAHADRIHFGGSTTGRTAGWADAWHGRLRLGYVIEYSGPSAPRTVGLTARAPGSFDGYTLIAPLSASRAWLVDPRGRTVHQWSGMPLPGAMTELLANGHLLRSGQVDNPVFELAGGHGGSVQELDWQGNVLWSFTHSTPTAILHHDFERLPNGNTLVLAWEVKTRAEGIAAGRDPARLGTEVWPEKILEVDAAGQIVWEWHTWDHLIQDFDSTKGNFGVVGQHPERIDVNHAANTVADWQHANALAYNPQLDQIALSVLLFNEFWIIDHSTTTAQAAGSSGGRSGRGGDLLYRWGNPATYRAGTAADQRLFRQHDVHWIPPGLNGAGHFLVFNNGLAPRTWSSVDEIIPPAVDAQGNYPRPAAAWGPAQATWSYTASPPTSFYSAIISGAQRLPNGNTLVCGGALGMTREVTPAGQTVWEYVVPLGTFQGTVPAAMSNMVFRSPRYAPDFPGLQGHTLVPGDPLERYTTALLLDGSTLPHHVAVGTRAELSLLASGAAGQTYVAVTSATPGTLPLDYRFVPLGYDWLLGASVSNVFPSVFLNYFGVLDAQGRASAALAVPPLPDLAGIAFHTTFVTLDPTARSGVRVIANRATLQIDP